MAYNPLRVAEEFIVKMDAGTFDEQFFDEAEKLSLEELVAVANVLEMRAKGANLS